MNPEPPVTNTQLLFNVSLLFYVNSFGMKLWKPQITVQIIKNGIEHLDGAWINLNPLSSTSGLIFILDLSGQIDLGNTLGAFDILYVNHVFPYQLFQQGRIEPTKMDEIRRVLEEAMDRIEEILKRKKGWEGLARCPKYNCYFDSSMPHVSAASSQ